MNDQVERDSAEWARMWAVMRERYGSLDGWQYMGTVDAGGERARHEFRIRSLPTADLGRAVRRQEAYGGASVLSPVQIRSGDGGGWRVYDVVTASRLLAWTVAR
jgi:hypothetical protein